MKRTLREYLNKIRISDRYGILRGALVLLIFVVAVAVTLVSNAYKQSKDSAYAMLMESALQSGRKLEMQVVSAAARLKVLSGMLSDCDSLTGYDAVQILGSYKNDALFSRFGIKFDNGASFCGDGKGYQSIEWSNETSLSGLDGDVTIGEGTFSANDGKSIFRIFVPIERYDAKLYGEIQTDAFSTYINSSGFDGQSCLMMFESESGRVLVDTGKWLDITMQQIGAVSKLEFEKGFSKEDFFRDLKNKKSGYTGIVDQNGRELMCAYLPLEISDWYALQIVPKSIAFENFNKSSTNLLYVFAVTIAGLVIFVLWIYGRVSKVKNDKSDVDYQMKLRESIIAGALWEPSVRIFLYYRKTGEAVYVANEFGTINLSKTEKNGLEHIVRTEGLGPDDARKLKNNLSLCSKGKDIKFYAFCEKQQKTEEYMYVLSAVNDAEGDASVVMGIVRRAQKTDLPAGAEFDRESFKNNLVSYNTSGIEIFLESNKWRFVWNNEPYFAAIKGDSTLRNNYDSDLENLIIPSIHYADRNEFFNTLSRLSLLEMFRNGKTHIELEYRILTDKSVQKYEYRLLEAHLLREHKTDQAKADIYIRNIDESFMTEKDERGQENQKG